MNLNLSLHLIAGLGALGMGSGVLLRDPGRPRSRHFALLCAAFALWNLGLVGWALAPVAGRPIWRAVYLLGSCATAPAGLQFALNLAHWGRPGRLQLLIPAYLAAFLLWLPAVTPLYDAGRNWPYLAIGVLGGLLLLALVIIGRHTRTLPPGPDRRAHQLVLWGGVVAVVGGMSDFLPRGDTVSLGPIAVLLFLLVICSVIVRDRFLDVDVVLIRAVALTAGAAIVAGIFYVVAGYVSTRYVALFLTSLLVLLAAGPMGRLILARARSLLTPADPVAQALIRISRRLPSAVSTEEIWKTIEEGWTGLPDAVRLDVYLRADEPDRFEPAYRYEPAPAALRSPVVPGDTALPRLLTADRLPLTCRFLEQERLEARGARKQLAAESLEQVSAMGLQLVAPLVSGNRLLGWAGLGGELPERYLTAEVATAFFAVTNQAASELERLGALEVARRNEALAAVGELAAGLAHEIRNPVAAIRGAAQGMGPRATEPQKQEMLEVIEEETARLGRVVGEFLDYARPNSPRRGPIELVGLIRDVFLTFELSGMKLETSVEATPDAPPVLGDPDQLRRVCENLVRNAWEAAGDTGRLSVTIRPAEDSRVAIRFEDNGPGISPGRMNRLFQPFHTTKSGGTGLGLALSHRIVEAHRGEIRVEGRPSLGAAFTVILPAAS